MIWNHRIKGGGRHGPATFDLRQTMGFVSQPVRVALTTTQECRLGSWLPRMISLVHWNDTVKTMRLGSRAAQWRTLRNFCRKSLKRQKKKTPPAEADEVPTMKKMNYSVGSDSRCASTFKKTSPATRVRVVGYLIFVGFPSSAGARRVSNLIL